MGDFAKQRIQREFREVIKIEEVAKSGVQLTLVKPIRQRSRATDQLFN
jgi:hypothetical protein